MSFKEKIKKDKLPQHIAIIMDGNGRWAKQQGKARIFGHKNAIASVRESIEAAGELGIKYLTLYAFSTENWKRPRTEINALMSLLVGVLHSEAKKLMENNVRLITIGDIMSMPAVVRENLNQVIEKTSKNTGITVVLALSYSSRWEIINALKLISQKIENKEISSSDINEELIIKHLNTADIPDPELLIRTSGEFRISNFLLWQIAYSELFFTRKLWPDFRKEDLYEAIVDYQGRERRFGQTSEQLK